VGLGYGVLNLTGIIQKSSSRHEKTGTWFARSQPCSIVLALDRTHWFIPAGKVASYLFIVPSNALPYPYYPWRWHDILTIQIARDYATIANQGRQPTISLIKAAVSTSS